MFSGIKKATPNDVFSHWFHLIEGLQVTPSTFYDAVERQIKAREIPNLKVKQVTCHEGGALSAKRIYLRVTRKGVIFDICGAPFAKSFFVSWWLGDKPAGLFKRLFFFTQYVPILRELFAGIYQMTYFKIDTMTMFQESVRSAVMEVVNDLSEAQGIKPLSELQMQPTMKL